jgi:hypothetical protein
MKERNSIHMAQDKQAVHDFWNAASCGEDLYLGTLDAAGFEIQMRKRYELEPYISGFAKFPSSRSASASVPIISNSPKQARVSGVLT